MLKVATYLGVDIFYDPNKHHFCAEAYGKKLHHKKQTKIEVLIKTWNDKMQKRSEKIEKEKAAAAAAAAREQAAQDKKDKKQKPKRKYTRHAPAGAGQGDGKNELPTDSSLPADLIKDLDDVDVAEKIFLNKLDKNAKSKAGTTELLISIARQQIHLAANAVKLIINHGSNIPN